MIAVAGPWIWDTTDGSLPGGYWRAPVGMAGLDLRPLPEQAIAGGSPSLSIFFGDVEKIENASDYTEIGSGSWDEIKPTTKQIESIPVRKDYVLQGETLQQLLMDLFIGNADPEGLDGPKPLRPKRNSRLELYVRGQKYSEAFSWGNARTAKVQDSLKREFARHFADANSGAFRDPEQHRKILGYWCEKYKLKGEDEWKLLVPSELVKDVPGPLKPETTITESFNKADSSTLGPDLTWTDLLGDIGVVSNAAELATNDASFGATSRAESDLSSDDHYAQVSCLNVASWTGTDITQICPIIRKDSTSDYTLYMGQMFFLAGSWLQRTMKQVSGTATVIGSNSTVTPSNNDVIKIEADADTITRYLNGSSQDATTDTAIAGNVRTGLQMYWLTGVKPRADSFEASDLSAGPTYTLTCGTGSFTLTNNASALQVARKLATSVASFTLTGIAAGLIASRKLVTQAASYVLTGQDVTLTYTPTGGPTYTLTTAVGTFTLTGVNNLLTVSRKLATEAASYLLTGQAIGLAANRKLPTTTASFTLAGQAATLQVARKLPTVRATFTLTGVSVTLTYSGAPTVTNRIETTSYITRHKRTTSYIYRRVET